MKQLALRIGRSVLGGLPAVLLAAGCYDKSSLDRSQVELVRVDGRQFEVRLTSTGTPNEYRMLVIRATLVINPDPELESARAREVAERYMKQTCKGRPYQEEVSGVERDINFRTVFRCV
ncbi:MAG: hypothetical protein KA171_00395 [Reyranella sp.]|nr:hypothetical protein [Reyranella sp.]